MANANSNATLDNSDTRKLQDINQASSHEQFHWLNDDAQKQPLASFVEQVKDIAAGIALTLEIVEMSDIRRQEMQRESSTEAVAPTVHAGDACVLRRFAIATSRMLARVSEDLCDWLNEDETMTNVVGARKK